MSTPRALYTPVGLYTQKVSSLPCAGRHVFYQRLTPFDMGQVSQVCLIEHSRNPQAPSSSELPTGLHPQHSTHRTAPSPCSQNLLHPLWSLVFFSSLPMRPAKEQTEDLRRKTPLFHRRPQGCGLLLCDTFILPSALTHLCSRWLLQLHPSPLHFQPAGMRTASKEGQRLRSIVCCV